MRHRGRMPGDDRGRGWRDAVTSQGRPRIVATTRSQKEARKEPIQPLRLNIELSRQESVSRL